MASEEPRLKIGSFALHAARGLVREPKTRRLAMFYILLGAILMLFLGLTFLVPILSPQEHPFWFLLYWAACGWLTLTAVLLAVFDILLVRLRARAERNELKDKVRPE